MMSLNQELLPTAKYNSPDLSKEFTVDPSKQHTTNGKTTGPSEYVLNAGAIDKDMPSVNKDTKVGRLRGYLTTLQDDVNLFLTTRMNSDSSNGDEKDLERRVLDEGVDEDDED